MSQEDKMLSLEALFQKIAPNTEKTGLAIFKPPKEHPDGGYMTFFCDYSQINADPQCGFLTRQDLIKLKNAILALKLED